MSGSNKGLILLAVLVLAMALAAVFMRGRPAPPESPDLPSVPIETQ